MLSEKITTVKARLVEVPLDNPVWLGGYSVLKREYCFVEVTTTEGRVGHALAFTRGGDLVSAVMTNVAPLVKNKNVDQIEAIWEHVYYKNRLNGRQGLLMRAQSLIDLALWDIKGKKVNQPIYLLLGGYRDSVPIIMAGGYYGPNKDLDKLCEEYMEYVSQGYKHVKLMVGGVTMEEDLQRFIAVRKALPKDVSLAVDVNGVWDDPKAVLRWIERAEKEGGEIAFLEEPLPTENFDGFTWLRNRTNIPIASGEFLASRWTFKELFEKNAVDIVRADVTLCGGITEWRRIAAIASAYHLKLIPHYFASLHLNVALAFPGSEMIEVVSQIDKNSSFALLAGESYEMKDGIAYPKHLPGLGLTIDHEKMDYYTVHEQSFH